MAKNLLYARKFLKNFNKRIIPYPKLSKQFDRRLGQFVSNSKQPLLKDHQLKGTKKHFRAFSITGNIRVIYQKINKNTLRLIDIGTHNQVY